MATCNDITGEEIKSRVLSKQGKENWDKIFNKKCNYPECKCPVDLHSGDNCVLGRGKVYAIEEGI